MFSETILAENPSVLMPVRLDISALASSPLPVSLDLIKTHCSIDSSDFDTLLTTYLMSAISWAEGVMHRTIFSRTHTWVLREFPYLDTSGIRLPRGKTQSVQSIQYTLNGTTTTLTGPTSSVAGDDYQEDLTGDDGGVLMPPRNEVWPSTDLDVPNPVEIAFTAGWTTATVPDEIIHALLFAVEDAFTMRGSKGASLSAGGTNLDARRALLNPYQLVRFYGGAMQ